MNPLSISMAHFLKLSSFIESTKISTYLVFADIVE